MPQSFYSNRLPAQSLAESFELPDDRYLGDNGPSAQPSQGGYQPNLPLQAPAQNLADVEGQTSAYYDTWGKLQSYAQGMQKEYGLDVTKPDFTQPGGGLPFQTYQKLSGSLMTVANRLGNRLKEQQAAAPYKHTGQVTGEGTKEDPYISTHLVPELEAAQKKAQDDFYTSGDARRAYDANIKPIEEELAAKASSGDPFWQRQYEVAKKLRTTFQTHPSYFRNEFDEQKRKLKAAAGATREIGVAKKLTAEAQGFWHPGSYEIKHEDGQAVAYKPAEQGLKGGVYQYQDDNGNIKTTAKMVDGWKRTPDGQTYMLFKSADGTELPPEEKQLRVDNMTGDQLVQTLQQHNTKLGQTPTMYQAADILELTDKSGGIDTQKLFGEDFDSLAQSRSGLDTDLKAKQEISKKLTALLDSAEKGSNWFGGESVSVDTPSGKVQVKAHKNGPGFYIEGHEKQHLTKDEVMNILIKGGLMSGSAPPSDIAPEPSEQAPEVAPVPQQNTVKSDTTNKALKDLQAAGYMKDIPVTSSQAEFDSIWATLKKGQGAIAPNGKLFVKGVKN